MCKVFSKHRSTYMRRVLLEFLIHILPFTFPLLSSYTDFLFLTLSHLLSLHISGCCLAKFSLFNSCFLALVPLFPFFICCVCACVRARSSFEARELCRLFWRLKWQMWVLLLEKYMLFTCMCERWESLKYFACFCIFQMTVLIHTHTHKHKYKHTCTHNTCSRSLFTFTLFLLFSHLSQQQFRTFSSSSSSMPWIFFSICLTFNGKNVVSCIQCVSKSVFQRMA